jgi:segregation and condensation protein B
LKDFEQIIEALLFASPNPLTQKKINTIFDADPPELDKHIKNLQEKYIQNNNAFEILSVAGGYQIRTKSEYDFFVRRLIIKSGLFYLSQAALESLSIIAYKQPISRQNIEGIRGVDCAGVLKTLLKKSLVKISGRDESPGRPLIYKTTDTFLKSFGLNKLSDLPKLKEISELIENEPELIEQIDAFK